MQDVKVEGENQRRLNVIDRPRDSARRSGLSS